jgi:Exodeoxyribonuclease X-like C-terminal
MGNCRCGQPAAVACPNELCGGCCGGCTRHTKGKKGGKTQRQQGQQGRGSNRQQQDPGRKSTAHAKEKDERIDFGKHEGRTFQEVFDTDKSYVAWVKRTIPSSDYSSGNFSAFRRFCNSRPTPVSPVRPQAVSPARSSLGKRLRPDYSSDSDDDEVVVSHPSPSKRPRLVPIKAGQALPGVVRSPSASYRSSSASRGPRKCRAMLLSSGGRCTMPPHPDAMFCGRHAAWGSNPKHEWVEDCTSIVKTTGQRCSSEPVSSGQFCGTHERWDARGGAVVCIARVKASGRRCGRVPLEGTQFCNTHASRSGAEDNFPVAPRDEALMASLHTERSSRRTAKKTASKDFDPVAPEGVYYLTKGGSKFHESPDCLMLRRASEAIMTNDVPDEMDQCQHCADGVVTLPSHMQAFSRSNADYGGYGHSNFGGYGYGGMW